MKKISNDELFDKATIIIEIDNCYCYKNDLNIYKDDSHYYIKMKNSRRWVSGATFFSGGLSSPYIPCEDFYCQSKESNIKGFVVQEFKFNELKEIPEWFFRSQKNAFEKRDRLYEIAKEKKNA